MSRIGPVTLCMCVNIICTLYSACIMCMYMHGVTDFMRCIVDHEHIEAHKKLLNSGTGTSEAGPELDLFSHGGVRRPTAAGSHSLA